MSHYHCYSISCFLEMQSFHFPEDQFIHATFSAAVINAILLHSFLNFSGNANDFALSWNYCSGNQAKLQQCHVIFKQTITITIKCQNICLTSPIQRGSAFACFSTKCRMFWINQSILGIWGAVAIEHPQGQGFQVTFWVKYLQILFI